MTTHILDTGEAYLSAEDKRFARVAFIPTHIHRRTSFILTPTMAGVLMGLAMVALTIAAFAV
jgi:hypothetical protein